MGSSPTPSILSELAVLTPTHRAAIKEAAASAFLSGFRAAMLVSALLAAVAAVVNWRLLKLVAKVSQTSAGASPSQHRPAR
jgi:hypothetical protein